MPTRPQGRCDLSAVRAEISNLREIADGAVQHEMNRIEAAFPGVLEHERRRLIAHTAKPHRRREDAALRELVAGLGATQRRALFDEMLDPRLPAE